MLYPRSTDDVVAIVRAASAYSIPLIPYAGGTSLEGHFYAPSKDVSDSNTDPQPGLSFTVDVCENMNRILQVHGELERH